ncbi:hypothetical protein [Dermatobacter hominis]|uniref:hypothetical protein n=1 Tax=Dermatobacter hominis TaxID=2884263 RepID=UPI001D12EEAA|nr:hypothetical protein [Dermatobacter hominis]UDY34629.1 hypothetical protein LH044_14950 [Dermatobacter hominis]
MPALRTEITEIVTGLGALGEDDPDAVLVDRPPAELRNVDSATWARLVAAHRDGTHRGEVLAAWHNGRALFRAVDGLRGRRPAVVEWKGGHRDPGDESVPADLRIDHVYLVSCKYLSKVLHNASPATVFDRLLAGAPGRRSEENWFDAVAAAEHQRLYQLVRRTYGDGLDLPDGGPLPEQVRSLTGPQRDALRRQLPRGWGVDCATAYQDLVTAAAERSAERWRAVLADGTGRERHLLWRILRLSSAPYFVLGTGPVASLRLRVATPWDWNQAFELRRFEVVAEPGGQARVGWRALVRSRAAGEGPAGEEVEVAGHVEVRWSHGRFGGHPEAKVYLDTPHGQVPGYFPLA